jgi:hypothetical protein
MSDHRRQIDHLRVAQLHRCRPEVPRLRTASADRLIVVSPTFLQARAGSVLDRGWTEDDSIPIVHWALHGSAVGDPGMLWVSQGSASVSELLVRLRLVLPMPAEEQDAGHRAPKGFEALRAAVAALYAVLTGTLGALDEFIRTWLGKKPENSHEAAATALLEPWWAPPASLDNDALVADLRRRIAEAALALKPLWERQVNYATVRSLSEPVSLLGLCEETLECCLVDTRTPEDMVLDRLVHYEHPGVRAVLRQLSPQEALIVGLYASREWLSWEQAAATAGASDPAATGDRIRRKLKRLGNEHVRRIHQLDRTGADVPQCPCQRCILANRISR